MQTVSAWPAGSIESMKAHGAPAADPLVGLELATQPKRLTVAGSLSSITNESCRWTIGWPFEPPGRRPFASRLRQYCDAAERADEEDHVFAAVAPNRSCTGRGMSSRVG